MSILLAILHLLGVVLLISPTVLNAAQKEFQKLSQPIRYLLFEIEARGITRDNARAMNVSALSNPRARVDEDGRVQIYIHLAICGETELATLRRKEVDIEIANDSLAIAQGWAPFDRLEEIAALPFVLRVTPPSYGFPEAGSVDTEGDAILKADQLRLLGFDGSGVRVGVISDGANDRSVAQASGDLPANITVFGICTPRPYDGAKCDRGKTCNEGTAMLEIVHDIAPGAQLAIASASTSLEFVQRVDELVNSFKADIIVDDLGFFSEPYFSDGVIAQMVGALTDQTIFISAAGNSAERHYEANYLSILTQGLDLHNFGQHAGGATDWTMNVIIDPGQFFLTFLQWNDPFGASANDYDLYLVNQAETEVLCPLCGSSQSQTGFQDPIEAICYFNDTSNSLSGKIIVNRVSGANKRIEMFMLGGHGVLIEEYGTPDGSVFGHAGIAGVLAVGAIDASDPGNENIEPFSSRGPARIDFPSLQIRKKPDLTGIDGVSVTGTGGFPNVFFGTSAAAPHIAGVAALLKQRAPWANPKTIRAALVSGAVDLGLSGPDNIFGAGRVDAREAFDALPNVPTVIQSIALILLGEDPF